MIIGISGTLGSGKDTVAELLEGQGFQHVSTGELIREELTAAGRPITIENQIKHANDRRRTAGNDVFVRTAIEHYELTPDLKLIVSGIRNQDEAKAVLSKGGRLLFVDAPIKSRFERYGKRRRVDDTLSFAEFQAIEDRQMNSTDPSAQNIGAVKKLATDFIDNSGSLEDLSSATAKLIAR